MQNPGEKISKLLHQKKLRTDIMSLSHDTPLVGHLGNKKTRERIMQHFSGLGMYIDISRYCKSCSACPKGTPKARLVPIPPIEVPFSRVAIDFVGTLQTTEKKNRYITFWYVWIVQRGTQKRVQ